MEAGTGRVRRPVRGFLVTDRVVRTDGTVEGGVVEATREPRGHSCRGARGSGPRSIVYRVRLRCPPGQKALDAANLSIIERRSGAALAKGSRSKLANKAVDAEAAHDLVKEA